VPGAWLGHVSLDTTHIYAEVDLEMKAKALASVDITGLKGPPNGGTPPSLLAFLKALIALSVGMTYIGGLWQGGRRWMPEHSRLGWVPSQP
jgi:hypothetical protein